MHTAMKALLAVAAAQVIGLAVVGHGLLPGNGSILMAVLLYYVLSTGSLSRGRSARLLTAGVALLTVVAVLSDGFSGEAWPGVFGIGLAALYGAAFLLVAAFLNHRGWPARRPTLLWAGTVVAVPMAILSFLALPAPGVSERRWSPDVVTWTATPQGLQERRLAPAPDEPPTEVSTFRFDATDPDSTGLNATDFNAIDADALQAVIVEMDRKRAEEQAAAPPPSQWAIAVDPAPLSTLLVMSLMIVLLTLVTVITPAEPEDPFAPGPYIPGIMLLIDVGEGSG
ncbi:hypothetical protein [Actinoplanes rectilineatus]|uniref:hypothetical protein n=1 Tax=Actinoplanes rectilineatus TaxID=113571 RepID=UPI0005F2C124|nr:hypothetical protein [Actinoplanes rectilineatus]